MHSERLLQLLAKKMGHAASQEELQELEELIRQNPEHTLLLELLQSLQGEKLHQEPAMTEQKLVDESWSKLQLELNPHPSIDTASITAVPTPVKRLWHRKRWAQAAIWTGIFLLAGSAFYWWMQPGAPSPNSVAGTLQEVTVPYGSPEKKVLPDSTVVWLNAGSHIRYAADFIQQQREVYLEGEAYFQVSHDPQHPFIVHAGNIAVRALGTEFNVHAYKDEQTIEATLISGKVQVTMTDKPDQRIILEPHEKLTVTRPPANKTAGTGLPGNEVGFQVQDITPAAAQAPVKEVAWMQDQLAFQNEAFKELAKRMERRYNKHILFTDNQLEEERLNGVFDNESIEKALGILQMTTPFRFRIQGDTVILSKP